MNFIIKFLTIVTLGTSTPPTGDIAVLGKYVGFNPYIDPHQTISLTSEDMNTSLLQGIPDSSFVFAENIDSVFGYFSNGTLLTPSRAIWVFTKPLSESLNGMKEISEFRPIPQMVSLKTYHLYYPKGTNGETYKDIIEKLVNFSIVPHEYSWAVEDSADVGAIAKMLPNTQNIVITNFRFFLESGEQLRGKKVGASIFLDTRAIQEEDVFTKIFSHELLHLLYQMEHCPNEDCIMHKIKDGEYLCTNCRNKITDPQYLTQYFFYVNKQKHLTSTKE